MAVNKLALLLLAISVLAGCAPEPHVQNIKVEAPAETWECPVEKPTMQSAIGIARYDSEYHWIIFQASDEVADTLAEFGEVNVSTIVANAFMLYVDTRYDFWEVLRHIQCYDEY